MKQARRTLQPENKTLKHPSGITMKVLVKVDKLWFPIDFAVMDIDRYDEVSFILDRIFMKTA